MFGETGVSGAGATCLSTVDRELLSVVSRFNGWSFSSVLPSQKDEAHLKQERREPNTLQNGFCYEH